MRFNPHAFKRANGPDAVSTSVVTDAIAATNSDALPSSILHPPSSLPPATTAFIAAYGRPGANQITVPEGSLAVTLSLKFNDSAPQVDHFDYHAPTGCPAFLVLLVKKQAARARFAQTENLARKALTACPELHSLDWTWKSEKYGGGHGNYLQSSYFPTPPALKEHITVRKTFGNGGPDAVSWEIQFANAWRGSPLQLWPHKHYGDPVVDSPFSDGRHTGDRRRPITAAWRLNDKMRGVEIHFTDRPDDATLAPLRGDRAWRYTGKTKCWYARQTDATVAWAKAFCEHFNGAPVLRSSTAEGGPVSDPARLNGVPGPVVPSVAQTFQPAGSAGHQAEVRLPVRSSRDTSPVVSSPIVPRLPSVASERRTERKFIRYAPNPSDTSEPSDPIIPMLPTPTPNIADLMRPKV